VAAITHAQRISEWLGVDESFIVALEKRHHLL
jgi:hypothetical protein